MGPEEFRKLALCLPDSEERQHMDHPDFRVGERVFATLGYPDENWAMVKLTREQQAEFIGKEPAVFAPVKGRWGRNGATHVRLRGAPRESVKKALELARGNLVGKKSKKKVR
jgi:hypothetical protein